jgi:hypothetical protein
MNELEYVLKNGRLTPKSLLKKLRSEGSGRPSWVASQLRRHHASLAGLLGDLLRQPAPISRLP